MPSSHHGRRLHARRVGVRPALLALLLILLPIHATAQWRDWTGARFPKAEYRILPAPQPTASQVPIDRLLDLTLVWLRGTPWSEKRILSHVERTRAIYRPCGIGLGQIVLARVHAPEHDLDLADLVPGSELPRTVVELSRRLPRSTPWPAVFFIGKLSGGAGPARAFRRGAVDPKLLHRYPYMNTAWLSFKSHWVARRTPEYSTLAHEVGHLLCECGHTNRREPHLMNGYRNFLGVQLESSDCEAFRKSPLVRPVDPPQI